MIFLKKLETLSMFIGRSMSIALDAISAVLETSVPKVLNNGRVGECQFTMVQTFQWRSRLELNC